MCIVYIYLKYFRCKLCNMKLLFCLLTVEQHLQQHHGKLDITLKAYSQLFFTNINSNLQVKDILSYEK